MNLAILGHGNVTRALLPLLAQDDRFTVAGIYSRSRPAAASVGQFLEQSHADVLVELTTLNPFTGEPAISHIRVAFALGMHVVTANKGPVAHAFHALSTEAAACGRLFRFESAVMDGAPVFNLFRNCLPRVRVLGIAGVLNSTTRLVIEEMERGGTFEDGVAHAQRLGVAEADASYDTEGWDAAAKIAALANVLMDARTTPQDVEREGLAGFPSVRIQELVAKRKTVRLVSRAALGEHGALRLSARPEILDDTDILAAGSGTTNVVVFDTDRMGRLAIAEIAPGVAQTAYGVYADLISLLPQPVVRAMLP